MSRYKTVYTEVEVDVPNGVGEWVDLTKLFEQYTMIQILKGKNDGNSKNSN